MPSEIRQQPLRAGRGGGSRRGSRRAPQRARHVRHFHGGSPFGRIPLRRRQHGRGHHSGPANHLPLRDGAQLPLSRPRLGATGRLLRRHQRQRDGFRRRRMLMVHRRTLRVRMVGHCHLLLLRNVLRLWRWPCTARPRRRDGGRPKHQGLQRHRPRHRQGARRRRGWRRSLGRRSRPSFCGVQLPRGVYQGVRSKRGVQRLFRRLERHRALLRSRPLGLLALR
mmetsp:Transcript_12967/g.41572  ORF Transcript_12967/g.41572 Transcript_12967/m.41572 type:complete len:223 (-) Transcript_12967:228-896(-)